MTTAFANETEYRVVKRTICGNTWAILLAIGKLNYVTVRKITKNPFGSIGKQFKDFDEAKSHYKSPDMKMNLELAELELTKKF